jgi:hypothetical protein
MSGFHYHEFQALNRLLDAAPQKVLRQISIRAGITAAGAWAFNPDPYPHFTCLVKVLILKIDF